MEGSLHSSSNRSLRLERHGHNCGASAAQKGANRARLLGLKDRLVETTHEGGPVRLVKAVRKGAAGLLISTLKKSCRNSGRVLQIGDSVTEGNGAREKRASRFGRGL